MNVIIAQMLPVERVLLCFTRHGFKYLISPLVDKPLRVQDVAEAEGGCLARLDESRTYLR